jgi:hypothetical protein
VPGLYVIDQGKRNANGIVARGLNLNPFQSAELAGNSGGDTVATYVGEVPLYIDLSLSDIGFFGFGFSTCRMVRGSLHVFPSSLERRSRKSIALQSLPGLRASHQARIVPCFVTTSEGM